MAWTIADGLGWLPAYPGRVPHRILKLPTQGVGPSSVTIVIPLIPGSLAFLPTYPNRVPHHPMPVSRSTLTQPPEFPAAVAPLAWLPRMPDQVPHRRLASAQQPPGVLPPPGELIAIAQRLAWLPRYPATIHRTHALQPAGVVLPFVPSQIAAGVGCLEWADGDLAASVLVAQTVRASGFVQEALGVPSLVAEDLC